MNIPVEVGQTYLVRFPKGEPKNIKCLRLGVKGFIGQREDGSEVTVRSFRQVSGLETLDTQSIPVPPKFIAEVGKTYTVRVPKGRRLVTCTETGATHWAGTASTGQVYKTLGHRSIVGEGDIPEINEEAPPPIEVIKAPPRKEDMSPVMLAVLGPPKEAPDKPRSKAQRSKTTARNSITVYDHLGRGYTVIWQESGYEIVESETRKHLYRSLIADSILEALGELMSKD